jgi:hypothetical protein
MYNCDARPKKWFLGIVHLYRRRVRGNEDVAVVERNEHEAME